MVLGAVILCCSIFSLNYNLRLQFVFYLNRILFLIDLLWSGKFKNKIFINNFLIFYLYNFDHILDGRKMTPSDYRNIDTYAACLVDLGMYFIIILRLCTYFIFIKIKCALYIELLLRIDNIVDKYCPFLILFISLRSSSHAQFL